MKKTFSRSANCVICSLMLTIAVLSGCSGGGLERPDVVPVSGVVMYNGNPVAGALVSFTTDAAPRAASGVTNDKGEFSLSTFGANDGAVPGTHKITVTKKEAGEAPANSGGADLLSDPTAMTQSYTQQMGGSGKAPDGPKSLIPEKYGDLATTPLSEEVKVDGDNQFVLQLAD